MNATQIHQRITAAHSRIELLEEWIEGLEAAEAHALRHMPDPSDQSPLAAEARETLKVIRQGFHGEAVRLPEDLLYGFTEQRLPGLEAARDEVDQLRRAIPLLEADLPSDEALADAEAQVATLNEMAAEADQRMAEAWAELLDALKAAEAAGRRVVQARAERRKALDAVR